MRLLALVAAGLLALPASALAVTFADGQLHIIDAANSFPFESVVVEDAPGGGPTSLLLVDGGLIGTQLQAYGHSEVTIFWGHGTERGGGQG